MLQVKEACASVLEPFAGRGPHAHRGERVVAGLMQCASDIFLGWANGDDSHRYYVRPLRDMKTSVAYDRLRGQVLFNFAATQFVGFSKLGFRTDSAADMNKEYFTIMSYDDQDSVDPNSNVGFSAFTPMILDVIARQQAYGEGAGTSGPGNVGYRTYFDAGGQFRSQRLSRRHRRPGADRNRIRISRVSSPAAFRAGRPADRSQADGTRAHGRTCRRHSRGGKPCGGRGASASRRVTS